MPVFLQYIAAATTELTSWPLAPAPTPILGAFVACDVDVHDQTYFLGILDNSYPLEYIVGLKRTQNSGYEQFQGAAKVAERTSIAIGHFECDSFVISAEGGQKATGIIEVWKTDPSAFTLLRGTKVSTIDGREFVTTEDIVFDGIDPGPFSVGIEAVTTGYEYNTQGEVIARNGELLSGDITQLVYAVVTPDTFDPTIQIRQILPTTGGRSKALDGLGADLGIDRIPFESDDEYRLRIKEIPDTVSPNAIIRGVNRLLQARDPSLSCTLREIGYPLFPGMYYDAGSSFDSPQNPDHNFAWDMDPNLRPADYYKLLVNNIDRRAFFIVEVPVISDSRDFGFVYDVAPTDAYPLANAYDTTAYDAKDAAYDGFTTYSGAFYKAIYDVIDQKRAAGVGFTLFRTFTPISPGPAPV